MASCRKVCWAGERAGRQGASRGLHSREHMVAEPNLGIFSTARRSSLTWSKERVRDVYRTDGAEQPNDPPGGRHRLGVTRLTQCRLSRQRRIREVTTCPYAQQRIIRRRGGKP